MRVNHTAAVQTISSPTAAEMWDSVRLRRRREYGGALTIVFRQFSVVLVLSMSSNLCRCRLI